MKANEFYGSGIRIQTFVPGGILAWNWLDSKMQEGFGTEFRIVLDRHFLEAPWCDLCNVQSDLIYYSISRELGLAWPAGLGQDVPSKATFILLELRDKNCVWRHPVDTCISLHGHQIIHKIQHPVQCIIQGKPWQSLMRHKARTGKQPLIYFLKVEAKKRIKEALNRPRIIAIWRLT